MHYKSINDLKKIGIRFAWLFGETSTPLGVMLRPPPSLRTLSLCSGVTTIVFVSRRMASSCNLFPMCTLFLFDCEGHVPLFPRGLSLKKIGRWFKSKHAKP